MYGTKNGIRMQSLVTGIHHVTAIASDAQRNVDFYTGLLGLRMVKQTVNFDANTVYHFYYGNEVGAPGTIITFFPYSGLVKGRHGKGFLNTTTFSISYSSLDYWLDRLRKFRIHHKEPQERLQQEVVVYIEDPDGLGIELIFNDGDARPAYSNGVIPAEHAIKGFYSVELWYDGYEKTAAILTSLLDHKLMVESGNRFRFAATPTPGNYVDVMAVPESLAGRAGSGTVHHIAFSTANGISLRSIHTMLVDRGLEPTEIKDRNYFRSIYFREPGGVLFEIATADDSFIKDEPLEKLGRSLMLPSWMEHDRENIVQNLPKIKVDTEKYT